uniref:Uncharacterized protein n=1 Tax=Chromera velia CCMP2878 TaxID=1169474 RepID=A0A0G4HB35_9ALVE|eukprot:Cvel_25734.t1-p1 / transcript=Cvel_25734.t1 / gene=Cvel_25734 / organism=Chromera_velia_CCMP2878 / gene_product=hypothetical protein / transcript_product=hypothetical protein / location=Cvel_scaffold2958:6013-19982(-) / protein_length=2143 / sequence_SO=supercontig / SO=protein_coding / is_pseudo=false
MLGRRDRSSAGAEDKMERLKLQALHLVERLFDIHQDAASEVFLGTRSLSEWMVEALRCAHSSRLQVAVLRCLAVYFAPSLHFQRGAGSSAFEVAKALLLTALPSEDEEVCLGEPAAAEEEEEVSERREVVCWAASLCATAVAAPSVCLGSSSFLMPSETVPRDLFFSVLLSETLVLLDPPGPDSSGESFRWDLRGDVTGACRGLLEGGAGCLSEDVRNLVEATGGLLEKNRDGESTRASERGVRGDSGRFVEASVLLNLSLQSLRGFLLSEDTADKAPPGHQKGAKSGRGRGGGVGSRLVSLGASKGFGGGGPSAAETAKDRQRETEKGRRLESLGRAALSCSRLSEVSRTVVSLPCGDESPLIPLGSNEGGRGEDTYSSRLPKSPPSSPSEMLLSSVVGLSSLVSRLLSRDLEGGAERHNGIPGPMDAAVCVLGAVAAESLCLTMAGALVCLGREGGEGFSVTPWLWGVRQCGEVAMQARMGLQSLVEGGMKETFWKGMVEEMGERLEKAEAEMDDALVISGSLFSVLESQCFGDPLEWNQGGRWLGGEGISEEKEDRAAVIRRVLVWWGKQARRNSGGGKASKENGFIRFLCGEAGEGGGMVESGGEGEEDFSLNFVCTALADSSRELPLPLFALRGDADTESLLPHAVGVSALLLCLAALSGRPSDTRNGQLVPVEGDRTGGETEASQSQSLVVSSSESQTQSLDLTGLPVSNSQEEEVKQSIKKSRRRKEENKEDREAPPLFDPLPAQSRLTVKDRFLSALCRSILPLPAWGGDSNPEGPGIAPMAAGGGLLEVVLRSAVVLEVLESAHPALMEMEKDGGEEREAVESQAAAGWGVPGGWKRRERDAEIVKERERERLAREQEKECVENVLMLSSALALLRLGKSVDSEEWEGLHMLMAGRGPSGLWEGGRERQKSEGGGGASPFLLVRFFSGFLSRQRDLLEILQERQAQRERQQEKMNKSRGGGDAEERGPADEFECPLEVSRHFVLLEARRLWGCLTERRRGVRGEEDTGVMPVSCCQIVSPLTMSLCGDPDSLDLLLDIALDLFGSADTEGEGGAVRNAERGQGQGVSSSMWEEVTGLVGLLFVAGSRLDGAERGGGTCARSSAVEFWKAVTEKEGFVESLRSLLRGMSDRALVGEREAVEESGGIASFSQTSNSLLPSSSGASQETETGTSTEGRHTFFSSNALGLEVLLGLFELLVEGGQRTGGGGERDGSRVGLGMRDKRNVWALEVVAALHQCAARVWTDRLTGVDPEGGPANGGTSGRKPPQKNESGASGCPFLFRQMVSTVRALAVSSLEGSGNDAVLRLLCASSWVPLLIASGVRSAFTDAEREVHRLKKESPPPDLPPARTRQTRPYLSTQSQSQSQRLGLCPSRPPDSFRQQLEVGATCNANTNTETGMERGVRRWEQKWRWWDVAAASGVELGLFVLQTSAERAGETVTGGGDVPTAFCCLALDPLCRDFASGGSATSGEDAAGRGDGISSSSSSSSCADLLFPAFSSRCPLLSGAFATFLGFVMHSHANTQMARAACMEAQAQRRGRPLNSAFLVDPLGPLSGSAAGAASFGCLESPVACGLCAVPSAVREVTENAAESAVVVGDLSEREKLLAEEDRQDLRESLSLKEILEAERKIRAAARRGFLSFVCVGLLSDAVPAEIREFLLFGASGMHTCLVQAFLVEPLVNLVGWERESQREKGEGGGKGASGGRVVRFWDRKEKERNGFGRTGRDRDTHKGGGREAGRGAMMSFEGSLTKSKLNLNAFFLKDEAIRGPLWLYLSSLLAASPEWLPLDSLLMPQVLEGLSLLPRADRGRGRKDGEETWREEDEEEEQGVDLMESAEGFRLQLLRLEGDLRSSHKQRHVAGRKGGPNLFSHNSLAGTVQNPNGHRRAKPVSVSQGLSHSKFDVPPAEGMQKRQQTEGFPYTVPQRTNRFLQNPPARQTEGGAREMDRQRGFYGPLNRPGLCAVEDRRGRYYAEEGGGDGRAVGQEGKEMFPEYCVKKPGGTEWGWGEKGAEMNKKGRDRRGLPSSSKNGMEMRISHDRWEGAREEEREGDDVARQEVRGGGEQNGRVLPERDESMPLSSAVLLGSEVCFQGKRMGAWTVSQTMKDDAGLTWALCCLRVGRQVEASCASLIRSLRESLG